MSVDWYARCSPEQSNIARQFWENAILAWEEGRYRQSSGARRSFLDRLADRASWSLRFRQQISVELIRPYISGKRVLEVGCGSGLLAPLFMAAGASSYRGLDIAQVAIRAAGERKLRFGWGDAVQFSVGAIADMPVAEQDDVVFSLGVLDWLTDWEMSVLFRQQGSVNFLHSISEPRLRIQQWLHRAYVYASYGHRTNGYVPRLFSAEYVSAQLGRHFHGPIYVYRDPRLSFGALVSSFPIGPLAARASK